MGENLTNRGRRNFSYNEKLKIIKQTKLLIDEGIAKSVAPLQVAGVYWQRVETWCMLTQEAWDVMYPGTTFPHHIGGESGRHKDRTNLLSWNQAVKLMHEGLTIRAEDSMLYRYTIEDGKLVEWRRDLGTFEWAKADDVTIDRYNFKRWMYEVVE
jgi:hypothetical protein